MATAVKRKLSGSTNGRGIKVVATATLGTTVHTAVAGTTPGTYDEIWLFAYNSDTVTRLLTIEFGGVTVPDDTIKVNVASQSGLMLIVPGLPLQNGCAVTAFAAAANVITIHGFVNAITD
jgi:uncharacterized membrane protein YjjP (DUF1212 family)